MFCLPIEQVPCHRVMKSCNRLISHALFGVYAKWFSSDYFEIKQYRIKSIHFPKKKVSKRIESMHPYGRLDILRAKNMCYVFIKGTSQELARFWMSDARYWI